MTLSLRRATVHDATPIAQVHVAAWQSAYRGIVADEFLAAMSVPDRSVRWSEILQQPEQAVFVAEVERSGVVGFANGGPERECQEAGRGELYALYVHPDWQRQGIGNLLVAALTEWLHQGRFVRLLVLVLADNPARAFYESLGGVLAERRMISMGKQTLEEVAYRWSDLGTLIERRPARLDTRAGPLEFDSPIARSTPR
jgi:ribosomal protein S18 acetylase RimI-like enzyme